MNKSKGYTWLVRIIKFTVIILVGWIFYKQLLLIGTAENMTVFRNSLYNRWWLAILAIGLFPINYVLEVWKWWVLTRGLLGHRSITRLLKEVLSGAALAIITPNRVGAFVGRMVYFKPESQLTSVGLSIISSLSQLLVTVLFGMVSIYFLGSQVVERLSERFTITQLDFLLIGGCLLVALIIVFVTFRPVLKYFRNAISAERKLKWLKAFTAIRALDNYSIVYICFLSLLRLMVYSCQFLLFILFAGGEVDAWTGLLVIGIVYFLQSIVPLPSLLTLVLRGEVAIWLFNQYGVDETAVLLGSYLVWFVNLGIPALIGLFPLMKHDIKSVYK